MMLALFHMVDTILSLALWVVILSVLAHWLLVSRVVDEVRILSQLCDVLCRLGDGILSPFRRAIPLINGVDISPVAAVIVIVFVRDLLYAALMQGMMP